jgi:diacylglycerol kinase (ATP)
MKNKALVIFNPTAGVIVKEDVRKIVENKLLNLGYSSIFLILDRCFEDEIEQLDLSGISLVLAVGGDGTVKVAAREIIKRKIKAPLLIVPFGSANVFANALGLPIDFRKALDLLDNPKTIKVDVGRLDKKHYFLVGFSLGYVSGVVINTELSLKNKFGSWGYLIKLFWYKVIIPRIKFRIETEKGKFWIKGNSLIVFNVFKFYGFQPKKEITPFDGILNLYVVTNKTFWAMFEAALGVLFYTKPPRHIFMLDNKNFKIRIRGKRFLKTAQIDGDSIKVNRNFEIEILPSVLEVIKR